MSRGEELQGTCVNTCTGEEEDYGLSKVVLTDSRENAPRVHVRTVDCCHFAVFARENVARLVAVMEEFFTAEGELKF